MSHIVLASQSRQRDMLLRQIGIEALLNPVQINEELYFIDNDNYKTALKGLGLAKAKAAAAYFKHNIIVGADTVILLHNKVFPKPKSFEDARRMLKELSGKRHLVVTGIGVVHPTKGIELCDYEESEVVFKKISDEEINRYIRTGEPMGKAGAYAIQGKGAIFVKKIVGSYSNIVGLPLFLLSKMLRDAGYKF